MSLAVIGAGSGLFQVLDAAQLAHAVALFDNDPELKGKKIGESTVMGGKDELCEWHEMHPDSKAIISIGDPVPRTEWRLFCEEYGIPLTSIIDDTLCKGMWAEIGKGCLISAFCHVGTYARIGENCKLSPYCSIEHHAEVGGDCTFGPGVITSGCVKIGNRCKFGTGIFIEPHLTIGDDCIVASGAVVTMSVPPRSIVRAKVNISIGPRNAHPMEA